MLTSIYEKYHKEDNSLWKKFDLNITHEEVASAILTLKDKKNPAPVHIPIKFLKDNYEYLTLLLTDIFNMNIVEGKLPSKWREAFLLPIQKNGDKMEANNYRGVAILSEIPKLYDQLITIRLYNTVASLISSTQHGFNKERNLITNHLDTVQYIYQAQDKKLPVDIIYFDFSRAFDKLSHIMLV